MSAEIFTALSETADAVLEQIAQSEYSPSKVKKLRRFFTAEICRLFGFSPPYLSQLVDQGRIAPPEKDARGWRNWSLEEVQEMRTAIGREEHKPEGAPATVVAIANFKGGAAKTTVAVNLAQHLARDGLRVTLIDLDSQGSATTLMGLRPDIDVTGDDTALPWILGDSDSLESVARATYWPRLKLIPASLELYNAEMVLPTKQATEPGFRFWQPLDNGIATLAADTDVVILDCPPSLGYLSMNAIWAANGLIVPIPPAMVDFASARSFFQMAGEILTELNKTNRRITGKMVTKTYDFIKLLVTKQGSQPGDEEVTKWMRQAFGEFMLEKAMVQTAVISGSRAYTPLEIDRYDGSTKTFRRALTALDAVNNEIEGLVKKAWGRASKHDNAAVATG